jgi:hypothetical protein
MRDSTLLGRTGTSLMTEVPPALGDFARRLLSHEAGNGRSARDVTDALERACQSLHGRLAPLVSAVGFDALVARAVKLAAREFPFLAAVNVPIGTNCSVDGLRQVAEAREPNEVTDALVAILANLIWLLVIFIGENLGLRKVREVWPDVPLTPPGASSEKAPQ